MSDIYVEPKDVTDLDDCIFYHTMDVPGYGTVKGSWDLRRKLGAYLGNVSFAGKRVLDIGKASGVLSFYAESQGASEVVAFDIDGDRYGRDWVPYPGLDMEELLQKQKDHHKKLNNSFWLARKALGSSVKLVYGRAYDIPSEIGSVDVSILGSILLHTINPVQIIIEAAKLTKEAIIIADIPPKTFFRLPRINFLPRFIKKRMKPCAWFYPNAETKVQGSWWSMPPEFMIRALEMVGFEDCKTTWHLQLMLGKPVVVYTVVGRRTKPA